MVNLQKICRRQNHRFSHPTLDVRVDGVTGRTQDWSLGGIAVRLPGDRKVSVGPDDTVAGDIGDLDGRGRHSFAGRVVRVAPESNTLAIEFSDLSEGAVMMFVRSFRHMITGAA